MTAKRQATNIIKKPPSTPGITPATKSLTTDVSAMAAVEDHRDRRRG